MRFQSPQEAEDAFYDALEERDQTKMMAVWDDSTDIALLLPMQPLVTGGEVRNVLRDLLRSDMELQLQVKHIQWVEIGELAIHYVEEQPEGPAGGRVPPLYAVNIYRRRGESEWTMILHQNAPAPPPPGAMPPGVAIPPGMG
jgi:hypothetical protein